MPGKAPPPGKGPVDMDWEDDDEKTAVYDRGNQEDAAKALLRSAPPPAAGVPAEKAPKRDKVGAAGAIAAASGGAAPALPLAAPKLVRPLQPPHTEIGNDGGRMLVLVAAFVAIVAVVAAVLFVLKPFGKANLVVTVAGPNNEAVDTVEVVIEDLNGVVIKKCEKPQCPVAGVRPGMYIVGATAPGYAAPAPETLKLRAGDNEPHKIVLGKATLGTGIRVNTKAPGLRLSINGRDEGPVPKALTAMKPGKYVVRLSDDSGRYQPWEKEVEVAKDRLLTLDPALKVLKGLAVIKPGENAKNASVYLVTGNEKRTLTRLPIRVEIDPSKPTPQLVAKKFGYHDFVRDISFEDGIAVKTFTIDMVESTKAPPVSLRLPERQAPISVPIPTPTSAPTTAAPATAQGTISITSVPGCNAIVDGRPVGPTPARWTGPAGTHTVVFVHPEYGRKIQSITVKPGGLAVASARFP